MRPLKPLALRLGGLIAAVFGAVFFGAHTGTAPVAPAKSLLPDLQSKRVTTSTEVAVSRPAKSADEAPQPQSHFPFQGISGHQTPGIAWTLHSERAPTAAAGPSDQRMRLLIGVVELRI
jgi:hypothetical protein